MVEVVPGNRAQRFVFKGPSTTLPPNALNAERSSARRRRRPRAARSAPRRARGLVRAARRRPPPRPRRSGTPPAARAARPAAVSHRLAEHDGQSRTGWSRSGRRSAPCKPGAAIGIIPDGTGGTWLHHRSEPPIIHFDASGKRVAAFGDKMFVQAHGFCRDRDGNFWAGDSGPFADNPSTAGRGFQMFKFSPEGKVLLTLGKAGVSRAGERHLHRADGLRDRAERRHRHRRRPLAAADHGAAGRRSHRPLSRRTASSSRRIGKLGGGPGEFMGPHALAFDSQGRLFVADRSNNRVQIFDKDMKFVDEWRHFGRPSGVAILKDDTLDRRRLRIEPADWRAADGARRRRQRAAQSGLAPRHPDRQREGRLAAATSFPGTDPEGLAADELGNIFGGLTGGCEASASGGCLQKFVKR